LAVSGGGAGGCASGAEADGCGAGGVDGVAVAAKSGKAMQKRSAVKGIFRIFMGGL
jgi:hypothetical protein